MRTAGRVVLDIVLEIVLDIVLRRLRKSPRRHGRGVERRARDARLGVLDETLTRPLASAPLGDRVASGAMECVKTSACAASLGSTARASASAAPWFLAEAYECRATSYATCRWAPAAACPESATVGAFAPSVAHANANANAVGSNPGIGLLPLEPSVADAGAVGGILTRASGYPSASGGGYGVAPRPETRGSSDENVATVHVVDWTRIVSAGAAAFAAAALVAVARARGVGSRRRVRAASSDSDSERRRLLERREGDEDGVASDADANRRGSREKEEKEETEKEREKAARRAREKRARATVEAGGAAARAPRRVDRRGWDERVGTLPARPRASADIGVPGDVA